MKLPFLNEVVASTWWMLRHKKNLGDLWNGRDGHTFGDVQSAAFDSVENVSICFRNHCDYPLILCWADQNGKLYHYYRLEPTTVASLGEKMVTSKDRVEQTKIGHAFLLAYCKEEELDQARESKNLVNGPVQATFVGGYRAKVTAPPFGRGQASKHPIHILDIVPGKQQETMGCCGITTGGATKKIKTNLRGASSTTTTTTNEQSETEKLAAKTEENDNGETVPKGWTLSVCLGELDPTPLDTKSKKYTPTTLGGWPVFLDPDWDKCDAKVRYKLERDLEVLCERMPRHATDYLSANTPLYVNCSLQYGPKARPTRGKGACFHPGVDWLLDQGMHACKVQCVEMYDVNEHFHTSQLWKVGGVMLHEYSHAFHFKCLPGGYENPEILECYQAAMKEGLYDSVEYHCGGSTEGGCEKKRSKAYACNNQMEYFAELSAAFLGGLDEKEEFNKWFPFNRKQIKEHDPRAYELLKKVWKVDDDSDD